MINSPFVGAGAKITSGDVLVFLAVSKVKWPEIPNLKPRIRDIWWAYRLGKKATFQKQSRTLSRWMLPQLSIPRLWQGDSSSGTGKVLSSPAMLALVITLVSKVNVSLKDAWNMRLSEARWYDTVKAELDGAEIKIAYDNEEEFVSMFDGMSESEIVAVARERLGAKDFKPWLAARKRNKK